MKGKLQTILNYKEFNFDELLIRRNNLLPDVAEAMKYYLIC